MAKNIMIIGDKESFFIRVLAKKLTSEGFNAFYTPADVNAINAKWESSDLVTYYMETGETMADDVMRFLVDKMIMTTSSLSSLAMLPTSSMLPQLYLRK